MKRYALFAIVFLAVLGMTLYFISSNSSEAAKPTVAATTPSPASPKPPAQEPSKPAPETKPQTPAPPKQEPPAPAATDPNAQKEQYTKMLKGTRWKEGPVDVEFMDDGQWKMNGRICAKWEVQGNRVRIYDDKGEEHFVEIVGDSIEFNGKRIGKVSG